MQIHLNKKNLSSRRGFTLVELLVVIGIIGILSSVVLTSLVSARAKARDARRVSDIKQLQLALELYYDANNVYPPVISNTTLRNTGYISVIPGDPNVAVACTTGAESSCYRYTPYGTTAFPAVCTSYHIGATLEGTSNAVLTQDVDFNAIPSGLVVCTASGVLPGGDFAGGFTTCGGSSGADGCYDMGP